LIRPINWSVQKTSQFIMSTIFCSMIAQPFSLRPHRWPRRKPCCISYPVLAPAIPPKVSPCSSFQPVSCCWHWLASRLVDCCHHSVGGWATIWSKRDKSKAQS
jgi:hypothetical protein